MSKLLLKLLFHLKLPEHRRWCPHETQNLPPHWSVVLLIKELEQPNRVHKNIVICFYNESSLETEFRNPSHGSDGLVSEIMIIIKKVFLNDILVLVSFHLDCFFYTFFSRQSDKENESAGVIQWTAITPGASY